MSASARRGTSSYESDRNTGTNGMPYGVAFRADVIAEGDGESKAFPGRAGEGAAPAQAAACAPSPLRKRKQKRRRGKAVPTKAEAEACRRSRKALGRVARSLEGSAPGASRDPRAAVAAVQALAGSGKTHYVKVAPPVPSGERAVSRLVQMAGDMGLDGQEVALLNRTLNETADDAAPGGSARLGAAIRSVMAAVVAAELGKRGHDAIACGGEVVVLLGSSRAASRVRGAALRILEQSLRLSGCERCACSGPIGELEFCGCAFVLESGGATVRLSRSALSDAKDAIRRLTARNSGWSVEKRRAAINAYLREWSASVGCADDEGALAELDEFLARRLRAVFWTQWKLIRTKCTKLMALGVPYGAARWLSASSWGVARVAEHPIMGAALSVGRLRAMGFRFLSRKGGGAVLA